jgi:hypothetical protein
MFQLAEHSPRESLLIAFDSNCKAELWFMPSWPTELRSNSWRMLRILRRTSPGRAWFASQTGRPRDGPPRCCPHRALNEIRKAQPFVPGPVPLPAQGHLIKLQRRSLFSSLSAPQNKGTERLRLSQFRSAHSGSCEITKASPLFPFCFLSPPPCIFLPPLL